MASDPKHEKAETHPHDHQPLVDDGTEHKHYWEHTPSRRAVPQFDVSKLASKYLDDMEKGGRLHLQHKKKS